MYLWALWGIPAAIAITLLVLTLAAAKSKAVQYVLGTIALAALAVSLIFLLFASTFLWHTLLLLYCQLFLIFVAVRVFRGAEVRSTAINAFVIGLLLAGAYSLLFIPQALLLWSVLIAASIAAIVALLQLRVSLLR